MRAPGLERSTVSRLVAGLVDRGWVSECVLIQLTRLLTQLTDDGQTVAVQLGKQLHAEHTQLLKNGLTPAEPTDSTIGLAGTSLGTEEPALTAQKW